MKIKFWLFLGAVWCVSCGNDKTETKNNLFNQPNNTVLVFIDKTSSVDVSKPYIAQKYQQALTNLIEENIRKSGDRLEIYYIHENTAKGRCLSLFSRTVPENTEGMNATDIEAMETAYNLSIRRERNIFTQQAFKRLMWQNANQSSQETDVLATLPIIAEAGQTGVVKAYYFSDMVESMRGANRRDFHVRPPKDADEANAWAKADAEKRKDLILGSPDVTMILPFEPTSSTKENNPNITQYWKSLFENLGVMALEEL